MSSGGKGAPQRREANLMGPSASVRVGRAPAPVRPRGFGLEHVQTCLVRLLSLSFGFGFYFYGVMPMSNTEPEKSLCTWLGECCRQVEAEEVSNSRNKIHQTMYKDFFSGSLGAENMRLRTLSHPENYHWTSFFSSSFFRQILAPSDSSLLQTHAST